MMDQEYMSMKASASTTADYGKKWKGLWQDKAIASFYMINDILRAKRS